LTIDQHDLHSALSVVSRAVKGHPTMPSMGGVLLRAEGDRLHLTGTDLDLTIEAKVTARVEEAGAVILPGRTLLEITKKLPAGDVDITVDDNHNATITCGRSRFTLHGMAPRLFPSVPAVDSEPMLLYSADLRDILRRTTFAVSTDETRPILTGVQLVGEGRHVRAIATDGYRVAVATVSGPDFDRSMSAVIPGRALSELGRLLGDVDEPVGLMLGESAVAFGFTGVRLTTRLIDGQYPDVLGLLPSEYPHKVRVSRQELLDALQRVALIAGQNDSSRYVVRLEIPPVLPGLLIITASSRDLGTAREEVGAEVDDGSKPITIGFNARYLIEGLRVMDAEEVEIQYSEPLHPARIVGVGESGFQYVVLPVKLGEREGVPF